MKISIITPTFNSGKTIEDTLKSVASQTYGDYEQIIVDGASRDDTVSIVKQYQKKYPGKIKLISEKDKGIYDAMNKGIKLATGDVIGILNSDDVYYSGQALAKIAHNIQNNDGVFGNLVYVDETLEKTKRVWRTGVGEFKKGWLPAHPTFYVRKKVYDEIGNYNLKYRIVADYDFMMRAISSSKYHFAYIDEYLVKMRLGGASSDGLKGYVKNAKEANQALKNNHFKFSEIIIFRRILALGRQYVRGLLSQDKIASQ